MIKDKVGRPSIYNIELASLICERIAVHSGSLEKLCSNYEDLPDKKTIWRWRHKHPEFAELYRQAKISQIEVIVDEILEISDDTSNDRIIDSDGNVHCNNEYIARSRLRIDSRKWLAAKLVPRVYGKGADEQATLSDTLVERLIDKLVE